jgi:hypothetical protein
MQFIYLVLVAVYATAASLSINGDFLVTNLFIHSPFQVHPRSTADGFLWCKYSISTLSYPQPYLLPSSCQPSIFPSARQEVQIQDKVLTLTQVDFSDQDTVSLPPIRCIITWPVGLTPEKGTQSCANATFRAQVSDASYFGIQNFSISLSHRFHDSS